MYLTDSDTIKICWYWPDTNTDTRIGAALKMYRENFHGSCFICIESAEESHCSKDSLEKLLHLMKTTKFFFRLTFVAYSIRTSTVKWVRANFCETVEFCLRRKFCKLKVHDLIIYLIFPMTLFPVDFLVFASSTAELSSKNGSITIGPCHMPRSHNCRCEVLMACLRDLCFNTTGLF